MRHADRGVSKAKAIKSRKEKEKSQAPREIYQLHLHKTALICVLASRCANIIP